MTHLTCLIHLFFNSFFLSLAFLSTTSYNILLYIAGSVVGIVGIAYVGLHFWDVVEAPS